MSTLFILSYWKKTRAFQIVNDYSKKTSNVVVEYHIKDLWKIPKSDTCKFARHFADIRRKGCSITKLANVQFTHQSDRHLPSGNVFSIQRGHSHMSIENVWSYDKVINGIDDTCIIIEISKKEEKFRNIFFFYIIIKISYCINI